MSIWLLTHTCEKAKTNKKKLHHKLNWQYVRVSWKVHRETDTLIKCDQLRFNFQYCTCCCPYISSISVSVLRSHWLKKSSTAGMTSYKLFSPPLDILLIIHFQRRYKIRHMGLFYPIKWYVVYLKSILEINFGDKILRIQRKFWFWIFFKESLGIQVAFWLKCWTSVSELTILNSNHTMMFTFKLGKVWTSFSYLPALG